jgi:hypothetical protein
MTSSSLVKHRDIVAFAYYVINNIHNPTRIVRREKYSDI